MLCWQHLGHTDSECHSPAALPSVSARQEFLLGAAAHPPLCPLTCIPSSPCALTTTSNHPWGDVQLRAWPSRVKSSLGAGGITLGTSALPRDQQPSQEPIPTPSQAVQPTLVLPRVQSPVCPSNPATPLVLCSLPAHPQQAPASPLSPPVHFCPRTPTEGLGVDSPLIYHLSGGGLKIKINK